MPTYEYHCPAGHDFEKFYRKISDAPAEVPCPDCGAVAERRLSAGGGLLFKGSGFYITDYPKAGASTKDGGGGEPISDASGSGTGSSSGTDTGASPGGDGANREKKAADASKGAASDGKAAKDKGDTATSGKKTTASPTPTRKDSGSE
ncbi:MAG: FmdB family zinc ribbon protein [Gemmatimonadaceae bacterium]